MARQTEQVKRAIKALKNAGYARKEFSVQVERIYQGLHPETKKAMYAYGNAEVYIRASIKRQLELAQAVADNGISVTIPVYDGRNLFPLYNTGYRPNPKVEYWEIKKEMPTN
ncbi:hypothetical protein LCGC14_0845290 [marine sediment metagenome]|uniref:Uncharacterized protein n=1 Tax=marine sediment metagenome TaxID=412755 RepID=A0A0F9PGR5_9ZZZZ